jgi:hypothetical protein
MLLVIHQLNSSRISFFECSPHPEGCSGLGYLDRWLALCLGLADCLRTGTFFYKNPCPEEASTSTRISIYNNIITLISIYIVGDLSKVKINYH